MLVRSVSLFCTLCCVIGVATSIPFDPDKIIYQFTFDPENELFIPISQETVKHVYEISEMDVETYDVDGLEYVIQNYNGYPFIRRNLESSLPTSTAEAIYKIGRESAMGYFLYPVTALASETYRIKNIDPDIGNPLEERANYEVVGYRINESEPPVYSFFCYPVYSNSQTIITIAPSTTEASVSTVSSQGISNLTSEILTTEAVELNTSSRDTSTPKPEPDISTPVTILPSDYHYFYPSPHQYDPDILSNSTITPSATEVSESTASSQNISSPTSEIPTTVDFETSTDVTSTLKPSISTTEILEPGISFEFRSTSRPTISTTETVESRTSSPLPPTPKTPILSPANPTAAAFAITIVVVIAIIVIISFMLTILKEHFGFNYFVSSKNIQSSV